MYYISLTDDGSLSTDLYTKPTDKHQHLLYSSCHPLHTKKAILFSLALRLRRICSTVATFNTRAAQLTTYLLKRGYNRNFVTKQIRRASDIPLRLTLQTKDVNKPKRIPFITTFNPSLPHISNIIKNHHNLLLSSNCCKKVFQHLPVVAFRRSPNLRDLLVTAKLCSNSANLQLPPGSFRCGKNCATCPYNPDVKSEPTTAARHFLSSPNHTANDMQLIAIEKIFSNRDSIRKAREAFLIQKGRAMNPDGLNIREETF